MVSLLAAVSFASLQSESLAGRHELGERFRALEAAWAEAPVARRRAALPALTRRALTDSGLALQCDEAAAVLDGRTLRPEDAASLRFVPPCAASGQKAAVVVTWAYPVRSRDPLTLKVGSASTKVVPGSTARIVIPASAYHPSRDSQNEVGMLISASIGRRQTGVYLALAENLPARTAALERSADPDVRALASLVREVMEGRSARDLPLLDALTLGEALESGKEAPDRVRSWPRAMEGATVLRAALPDSLSAHPALVVALSGEKGTESDWFDGCGRGRAVLESLRRGWAFVGAQASLTALADAAAWFRRATGKEPSRIFVLGQGAGGAAVLTPGSLRPSAIALFAASAGRLPDSLRGVPLFAAYARQGSPEAKEAGDSLKEALRAVEGSIAKEYDPCVDFMTAADALPDVFAWLDKRS